MSVRCQTVINLIEKLAPKYMAEAGDPIGLQIGEPDQNIHKILVSLDLDNAVLKEAEEWGADLIVLHHTPFFKPLQNIRTDLASGNLMARIIRNNMALYTAHTNLDSARGGVNDVLAQLLGLTKVSLLSTSWKQKLCKLAVFVPESHSDIVREALTSVGAGWLGNYSDCTFKVKGTGTFRPLDGTNPFIGQTGQLAEVQEVRVETIISEELLEQAVQVMLKVHPYEEVAYDVYPLANLGESTGLGRIGYLPEPMTLKEFLTLVKEKLELRTLRFCGNPATKVAKVAVCGGAGASLLSVAVSAGADVFLTGDVKYHEAQDALAQNMTIVDPGHFATEYPVIPVLAEYLRGLLGGEKVEVKAATINTDPFRYW